MIITCTNYMARAYELLLCGQFIMCLINLKGYLFELVWHSYPWLLFKFPSLRQLNVKIFRKNNIEILL